jgi:hypothetical protein
VGHEKGTRSQEPGVKSQDFGHEKELIMKWGIFD